jgi:hypothetical protein
MLFTFLFIGVVGSRLRWKVAFQIRSKANIGPARKERAARG